MTLPNTIVPGDTTEPFGNSPGFATASLSRDVIAADVNGDSRADLIVANDNNTVSVLLNTTAPAPASTANPSFTTHKDFNVGANPLDLAVADINGDGRMDIVTANADAGTVSVLLNTTEPDTAADIDAANSLTFAREDFDAGLQPLTVDAADFNGDGRPDLVVPNRDDDTVSVLLNTTAPAPAATANVDFAPR
ncbi:MAG TPA: VCBS repeat-containing protein, partial [Gammaproteobacteria bacterium]|nr:VCBS repeat-containing protein [Gammaproteobacteria bacterium]